MKDYVILNDRSSSYPSSYFAAVREYIYYITWYICRCPNKWYFRRFWNVLYNSLLNMNFSHGTKVNAFADDLLVLTRRKSALDAENYANQDLKKIENWARKNKMYFNENKSNILLVTTKTSGDNRTLNIYLNNKGLEQVSELKCLGICFDSRFSFDRHVDYITGKFTPIINMLAKSDKRR